MSKRTKDFFRKLSGAVLTTLFSGWIVVSYLHIVAPPLVGAIVGAGLRAFLSADSWLGLHIAIEALVALPALLIALLVPLAIFMMDKKGVGFEWDKSVILVKVLNAKWLFVSTIAMGVTPMLWQLEGFRFVIVAVTGFSFVIILRSIVAAYRWLVVIELSGRAHENFRTEKRIEFLRDLTDNQKVVIWSMTWGGSRESRSVLDESKLIEIFIESVEGVEVKERLGGSLIREFLTNLDAIDLTNPETHRLLVRFSMKWASSLADPNRSDDTLLYFQSTVRRLYFSIMRRDLNDAMGCYLLYQDSRKYIIDNGLDESVFIARLAVEFLVAVEKLKSSTHVWEEFPNSWKVTGDNLVTDSAREWLKAYINWIRNRNMLVPDNESPLAYDSIADDVTMHLLPTVDPTMWSDILAFCWSPFGGGQDEEMRHAQVRGFAERQKRFGLLGRVQSFLVNDGESSVEERYREFREGQIHETSRIIRHFNFFFPSMEEWNLPNVLAEVSGLMNNYDPESSEYGRLQSLQNSLQQLTNG